MNTTLFTIPGFLSPSECTELIHSAERGGFSPAPVTTSRGFVMMPEVRNNTRLIRDDVPLAERLYSHLVEHLGEIERQRPSGLNERFRFYRYDPGESFNWHRDGSFRRTNGEESKLTFIVYLNEGFGGGGTEFDDRMVIPETGTALVFAHRLRHQGAAVTSGRKYVLRSDVMFSDRASAPANPGPGADGSAFPATP